MKRPAFRVAAVSFLLLVLMETATPCSWIWGYFHQVTRVKGRVVGHSLGPVQFRWLRRMFSVSDAELTLYEYDKISPGKMPPPVARIKANSAGEFEFANIQEGHYYLEIKGEDVEDGFDVEVTNKVPATSSILIDVSPVGCDCIGGHQFEVKATKK